MRNGSLLARAVHPGFGCGLVVVNLLGGSLLGWDCAAALPAIGTAFGTEPPVPVQSDSSGGQASLASDGENLFAVFDQGGNIRGMLIDADLQPLLAEMPYYADSTVDFGNYYPQLAFGEDHYLLVWQGQGVQALRIGRDATPLGEPFTLSDTGYGPSLAWVGDRFLVSWLEVEATSRSVALAAVDANGTVSEPRNVTSDEIASDPSMGVNADGYTLIAWTPNADAMNLGVWALIVAPSGDVSTPPFPLTDGGSPYVPEVTSDGRNFLVAWGDSLGVSGALVSPEGEVVAPLDIADGESLSELTLGHNDAGFVVMWQDYGPDGYAVYAFRHVGSDGQMGERKELPNYSASSVSDPALLGTDGGYWFAYSSNGGWAAKTNDELEPQGESSPLTLVQNSQNTSDLVWDGAQYVLTWTDELEGDFVYSGRLMRIDTAGNRIGAEATILDEESTRGSWYSTASAAANSTFISWVATDSRDVYTRVYNADGTLGPSVKLGTAGSSGGVTVASSRDGYLVVYGGTEANQFWAVAFDAAGVARGEPHRLSVPEGTYEVRALASDSGYLLQIMDGSSTALASLGADWVIGELQPIQSGTFPMDAVVGGGKTAVVWSTHEGERRARFWSNGAWDGDVFTLGLDGRWGDTTWDGERFVAVWQDSQYFAHWVTFDLERQVTDAEALFNGEECNGPLLASNLAQQYLLSCIRYNRDYSRRIVNYLVGQPTSETNSTETADDGVTAEHATAAPSSDRSVPVADVDTTAASKPQTPAAVTGESSASDSRDGETSSFALDTSSETDMAEPPRDSSGCAVSPRERPLGLAGGGAALLGLALLAARRRHGRRRLPVRRRSATPRAAPTAASSTAERRGRVQGWE